MYCTKCGSKLEEDAVFCGNCGEKVFSGKESHSDERKTAQPIDPEVLDAVKRLKKGEEDGFAVLYARTHSFVYSRARYLLHNEHRAQDLVQEVYLAAYQNIQSLKDNESVYGWLAGITFRQGTKMMRKNHGETLIYEGQEDFFEEVPQEEEEPVEEYIRQEDAKAIRACIARLAEEQKAVILAYYYDHQKVEDIAQMMDLSVGTVKSRLYLARKHLREYIEEQEKKQGYKFRSVGIPAWIMAMHFMLEGNRPFSAKGAENMYHAICGRLGISASAVQADELAVGQSGSTDGDSGLTEDLTGVRSGSPKPGAGARIVTKKAAAYMLGIAAAGVITTAVVFHMVKKEEPMAGAEVSETMLPGAEAGELESGALEAGEDAEGAAPEPEMPVFEEQVYELNEGQKQLLQWEMSFAARHVTDTWREREVKIDTLPDESILWMALDMIKAAGGKGFEGVAMDSSDARHANYELNIERFLAYLESSFGRRLSQQEVSNYLILKPNPEEGTFWWNGDSPEDTLTEMVGPVITESMQISEDRVRISGKYTGGTETPEEAQSTFSSEWELDAASATGGLRLKHLMISNPGTPDNTISASWEWKDAVEYISCAVKASCSQRGSSQATGTLADINQSDMMPLLRDLLLRKNLLGKVVQGDLWQSGTGEAYAEFTKEELENFCTNTLGCGFTEAIRANFEVTDSGAYRLRYYAGDYGLMKMEYLGDGTLREDGTVEFAGGFSQEGMYGTITVRAHENSKSLLDGYVIDSITISL